MSFVLTFRHLIRYNIQNDYTNKEYEIREDTKPTLGYGRQQQ